MFDPICSVSCSLGDISEQNWVVRCPSQFAMNARTETFELTVEGQQIEEAVASIFHTLLLHRTLGKFHYQAEGSYSIGTVGTEDIECNFIDLTYVRVNSSELSRTLDTQISAFKDFLRNEVEKQKAGGYVCLEFYQKHKRQWPLTEDIADRKSVV